eukprot:2410794-Pyramimonas_sp.AAC.1
MGPSREYTRASCVRWVRRENIPPDRFSWQVSPMREQPEEREDRGSGQGSKGSKSGISAGVAGMYPATENDKEQTRV